MFKAALLFSVLGVLHPQVRTEHFRAGHWRVERSRDTFTGTIACRAYSGALRIEGPAVVADFGAHNDVSSALYRLDGGPAVLAEGEPFNAQYHARLVGEAPVDNPSLGRIALPVSSLGSTHTVWIRTTPTTTPRKFDVGEIDKVRALETQLGCP